MSRGDFDYEEWMVRSVDKVSRAIPDAALPLDLRKASGFPIRLCRFLLLD